MDDEGFGIVTLRRGAERAGLAGIGGLGLVLPTDVGHPVRGPEPAEGIGNPHHVLGEFHHHLVRCAGLVTTGPITIHATVDRCCPFL